MLFFRQGPTAHLFTFFSLSLSLSLFFSLSLFSSNQSYFLDSSCSASIPVHFLLFNSQRLSHTVVVPGNGFTIVRNFPKHYPRLLFLSFSFLHFVFSPRPCNTLSL